MALFEKKSKVAKALELFNSFTDEELEEFLSSADLDDDGDVDEEDVPVEETTEETVEEPTEETAEVEGEVAEEPTTEGEEPTAEPVEETEEAPTEAEPGETEPSEAEEMPTEEAPTEDAPVEEKTEDIGADKYQALQSQIESLKEAIAGLTARIEADQENKEPETEPFGIGMQNTGKETDDKSDVQRAKEKYWAF